MSLVSSLDKLARSKGCVQVTGSSKSVHFYCTQRKLDKLTNVYSSVYNHHRLCCVPVCTVEPFYWTQAIVDQWHTRHNPHEPHQPMTDYHYHFLNDRKSTSRNAEGLALTFENLRTVLGDWYLIPVFRSRGGGLTKSLDEIHAFILFNELPKCFF